MKKFKKITDERLILKNLKHIRIAHLIQTVGIIGILIYEAATKGIGAVYETPLWWVFRLTITVLLFSSIAISIEHDTKIKSHKRTFYMWLLFALILSVGAGIITTNLAGLKTGLLAGAIAFTIGIIPGLYIHYLLKKQLEDNNTLSN